MAEWFERALRWLRAFGEEWGDDTLDWLDEHTDSALRAGIALFVAAATIWAAEGGRTRRKLKRIKEELEVLKLVGETTLRADGTTKLRRHIARRLNRYARSRLQRWHRRFWLLVATIFLATLFYTLIEFARASSGRREATPFAHAFLDFLKVLGGSTLAALVITALGGLVLIAVISYRDRRADSERPPGTDDPASSERQIGAAPGEDSQEARQPATAPTRPLTTSEKSPARPAPNRPDPDPQ